jgi:hypothetical protein
MKKITLALVVISTIILATKNAAAQQNDGQFFMQSAVSDVIVDACDEYQAAENYVAEEDINQVAIKSFHKKFKHAQNVKWLKLNDGYKARFMNDDVTLNAFFYPKGNYAGLIKGYESKNVSGNIFDFANENYPGYDILYVNEASAIIKPGPATYILQLKKKDRMIIVRFCDDEWKEAFDSENQKMPVRF